MIRFLASAFLFLLLSLPVRAEEAAYSETIEDLPLMQGMRELPDQAFIFDTPDGRVLETVAVTDASATEVFRYYERNLPQLGWQSLDNDDFGLQNYLREDERLSIRTEHGGAMLRIHFSLSPKPE